jgi:hypothetical protein
MEAVHAGVPCAEPRLRLRRHSFVLRGCFGGPIVCGVGAGNGIGQASSRDPCPRPHRPRGRAGPRAGSTPLATGQAGRGPALRVGGRPPDGRSASVPVTCARDVLRFVRAARAVSAQPAPLSNGRRNSSSGPHRRWLDCHRRSGRGLWPVERDREQAWVFVRANRPACRSGETHWSASARRNTRAALAPRPRRGRRSISKSTSRSSR